MSKKKHNKELILISSLYIASVLTFAAGSLGTYAWYSYNARAGVMYDGVAIGKDDEIRIGLYSEEHVFALENIEGVTIDYSSYDDAYVYWVSKLTEEIILTFTAYNGYAFNNIGPVSTGYYEEDDPFKLKAAPMAKDRTEFDEANTNRYTFLPLVFKTSKVGIVNSLYVTNCVVRCEDGVQDAVRIGFVDPFFETAFIFAPNAIKNGSHAVGGLLNLDKDNYYDFKNGNEYVYGEYSSYEYGETPTEDVKDYAEDELTTFNAYHKAGVRRTYINPLYTSFYGQSETIGQKSVTKSNMHTGLARLDFYVYIEGWDNSCVNAEQGKNYNLEIEFAFGE